MNEVRTRFTFTWGKDFVCWPSPVSQDTVDYRHPAPGTFVPPAFPSYTPGKPHSQREAGYTTCKSWYRHSDWLIHHEWHRRRLCWPIRRCYSLASHAYFLDAFQFIGICYSLPWGQLCLIKSVLDWEECLNKMIFLLRGQSIFYISATQSSWFLVCSTSRRISVDIIAINTSKFTFLEKLSKLAEKTSVVVPRRGF